MSSIVNKVKDALSSDKDTKHSTHHTTDSTEPRTNTTTTHAPHDGTYTAADNYTTGANTTGPASTTAGPHSSNVANKVDPRIDSDLDSRNTLGSNTHNTAHGTHGNTLGNTAYATHGTHNVTTGPATTTAGPHSSNLANKADPRVDSDMSTVNPQATHNVNTFGSNPQTTRNVHGTHGATHTSGVAGVPAAHSAATGPAPNTAGPHFSNLANKADPRVDSDMPKVHDTQGGLHNIHATGTHGTTHPNTQGGLHSTHTAGVAGAAAPMTAGSMATGPPNTTAGPHSSNLANKADPRVDSDMSNIHGSQGIQAGTFDNTHTVGNTGAHNTTHTLGHTGAAGTHNLSTGPASNTAGPHSSNLANKADPRVDSDMPKVHDTQGAHAGTFGNTGAHNTTHTVGNTGVHNTTHTLGHTGTTGTHAPMTAAAGTYTAATGPAPNTAGPHSSNLANKADPRVDSDMSKIHDTHGTHGTHNTTAPMSGATMAGSQHTTGTHAVHGSNPAVGNTHGSHFTPSNPNAVSSGPAPKTAGPHKSDLLNKLDPRVDSNIDGSKTVGGDKTFQSNRDPTDATHVPPSVLQQHVGAPQIHHNDTTHDRERRHSIAKEERHHGL